MPVLEWDAIDERSYELGVDHGVINVSDVVTPWNGLTKVSELEVSASELVTSFDGRPYANLQFGGFFQAKITALGFPDGLHELLGMVEVIPGLFLTNQIRATFDFSYRSLVEDDYYKIHFVHDATLTPTKREYETMDSNIKANAFEWTLDAIPQAATGRLPTSHIVVNSKTTDPAVLTELEELLYGTPSTDPTFPTQAEVIALFS